MNALLMYYVYVNLQLISFNRSTGMSPVTPKQFPMSYTDTERQPSPSFPNWCNSPSPSQISSTPSDHMLYVSRKSGEYDHSTFPRKHHPPTNRFWIPSSNQSVASTGSVEVGKICPLINNYYSI